MKLISSRKTLVTRWYTFEFCCHLHFSVPRLVNMDRRCSENDCGEVDMKVTAELSEGLKIKEEEQAICAVPWHIPISFHVCPLECSEDDEGMHLLRTLLKNQRQQFFESVFFLCRIVM